MNQIDLVPLWKALADPKRRRIVQMLGQQARTTGELCSFFDVSRFSIMRHLRVLEQTGFIKSRREGRQRCNYLNEGCCIRFNWHTWKMAVKASTS
jgi:DNA-binding transcriptional ArsR family regulator